MSAPTVVSTRYPPDQFLGRYTSGDHVIEKSVFHKMLSDTAGKKENFTEEQFEFYVDTEFLYADIDKDGVLSRDEYEVYYWSKLMYLEDAPGTEDRSPDLYVYFVAYSSRGSVKPIERMGLSAFIRMCRNCGILEPPKVNEAIADLCFYEAWRRVNDIRGVPPGVFPGNTPRAELKLDFFQFLVALQGLAGKLDCALRHVIHKILTSQAPAVAWSPGELIPKFNLAMDNLGGGGDEKKQPRKKLNNEPDAGNVPNAKVKDTGADSAHAKRLEWELQRLYDDLRQLERDLEAEKFARMDEQRSSRLTIDTLKGQLAAERSRREEIEKVKAAQIESLRRELAEALRRLEEAERSKREALSKLRQDMEALQAEHDREDDRRREEIRALRSDLEQERNLRVEEVAMCRAEIERLRAELDLERQRFETDLRDRLETIVRLRAELESAQRYRADVEREKITELAELRAKFETERREWEAKLRDKEEALAALREAKDREAARREQLEQKNHDQLSKVKNAMEQEKTRREAAELRAQSLEDRMKREIDSERAQRDNDARGFRAKIQKLEDDLAAEKRMRAGEDTKFRDQIYALMKEVEKEKIRRESDERASTAEISRLKLALEQERAARLKAESATQDMTSSLRVSETERARLAGELRALQGESDGKDARIRDLEAMLTKLISEYQQLVTNDKNLAHVMASLRLSLQEHGEKLEKRTTSQLDNLLNIVQNGGKNNR